jgi:hypothetical protein
MLQLLDIGAGIRPRSSHHAKNRLHARA